MKNFKFEFDFEEVIEGMKQGVIMELSKIKFDDILQEEIRKVKHQISDHLKLNYRDLNALKDNYIQELQKTISDELIREYTNKFESKYKEMERNKLEKAEKWLNTEIDIDEDYRKMVERIERKFYELKYASGKVEITLDEYKSLQKDSDKLEALENAGVDNWVGYDFAMEELKRSKD